MDKFLELVNKLPRDQKIIFYKYMSIISVCKMDVEEKIEFIESKSISLDTAKSLVRLFSLDIKSIKARFKLYQDDGLDKLVLANPEILRYSPAKVISRIKACEQVGKAYLIDGVPAPYLFDDQQWAAVKSAFSDGDVKGQDHNRGFDQITPATPDDYIPNESFDMDVLAFERYERLTKVFDSVKAAIGSSLDNGANEMSSDEYLMKEIGTNPEKTDQEILKGCLQACSGVTDGVDEIIEELLVADDNRGEKRGL